ncbi:MAG: trigger factor, partial [Myxococcota bacterium]
MNIEVEEVSSVERKITVQIPWDTVQKELDDAYRGLQKKARVRGFRPGKVPRKVLEQYYRQTVEGEVVGRLIDEGFRKAVDDNDLFPIDRPNLETAPSVSKGETLSFVATVAVKPEIDPQNVEGIEVERKVRDVTDEEVEAELLALREKATVVEPIEDRSEAASEDLAVVDFFGTVGGEDFKGGKGINYTVEIGSGRMIPGFEDQLIGMKIGDEKSFTLRFPEGEGPEEAQGKDVDWRVELKELKTKILPDLDDEFAKDLGEYDTLDELRDGIRKNLATREDAKSRRLLRNQVMEAMIEANEVDVPPAMVDRQIEYMLQDTLRYVQQANDPKIMEMIDKLRVEARPSAEKQVKGMLLLEGVARIANLQVSGEELEGRIQELSREHRIPVPQLRKQLVENDQIDGIRYNMLQDKALDHVVEKASI